MACAICETRRPRRFCPGVRGDICSICCGTEREVTVDCPLDCEFLQEARRHEKAPQPRSGADSPTGTSRSPRSFWRTNEQLLTFLGRSTVSHAALQVPRARWISTSGKPWTA